MRSSRSEAVPTRAAPRRTRTRAAAESPPRTPSSPARSPARTRRSSPPKPAPAVQQRVSTRRSPARKSPARKTATKFPARKSPSRTTERRKSPARRAAIKSEEFIEIKPKWNEPIVRLSRTRRSEYSIKDLSVGLTQVEMSVGDRINGLDSVQERTAPVLQKVEVIRRSSARLRDSDSRASESASRSLDLSFGEDSDEEPKREKSTSSVRKLSTPLRSSSLVKTALITGRWEFGGRIGSLLLMVILPVWVFAVLSLCVRSCSFQNLQLKALGTVALFSWRSTAMVLSQVCLQTLLVSIKIFGRRDEVMDKSGKQLYFNAVFATFITVTVIFAVDFFKILSVKSILEEYLRLATLFYILATLLALGLYWKSRKLSEDRLNPYGNTGYSLYDFWMGREIFPRLGWLDVKILLHRICNINGLILTLLIFVRAITLPEIETIDLRNYRDALSRLSYDPTLLVIASMQLIYFLNLILNEHKITSTFSWQSEGVGYLQTVSSALYPFYFVSISKFVLDEKITLSTNARVGAVALYLVGCMLYLASNNMKHQFRMNPLHPKLAHLDVMPTVLGKRLLVSGPWGIVRHPNYLGDILMHVALAVPGAVSGPALAILPCLTTVVVLVHRAARDGARCRRRYGAAWQRYCIKVPQAILPKIF